MTDELKPPKQPKIQGATPKLAGKKVKNTISEDSVRQKIISQGFGPTAEQRNESFDKLNRNFNQQYGGASKKLGSYHSPERLKGDNGEENGWIFKTKYALPTNYHTIKQSDDGTYSHEFYEPIKGWKRGQPLGENAHPKYPWMEKKIKDNLSEEDVSKMVEGFYKDWEYETDPETGEKYVHHDTSDNMEHVFNYPKEHYIEGPDAHKSFDDMVNSMVGQYGRRYKDGNQYDWTNIYRDAVRRAMKEKGINIDDDEYYQDDGWDY